MARTWYWAGDWVRLAIRLQYLIVGQTRLTGQGWATRKPIRRTAGIWLTLGACTGALVLNVEQARYLAGLLFGQRRRFCNDPVAMLLRPPLLR
jgi:hypothetical protein